MPTTLKLSDQYWYGNEAFADGSIIDPVKERLFLGNWIPQLDCGLDTTVHSTGNSTGTGHFNAGGTSWTQSYVKTMYGGLHSYTLLDTTVTDPGNLNGQGYADTTPRNSCICFPTEYATNPTTNKVGWSKMVPLDRSQNTTASTSNVISFCGYNNTNVSAQTMWVAIPAFMTRRFLLGPALKVGNYYVEPEITINSYNDATKVANLSVRLLFGTGNKSISYSGITNANAAKMQLYYNGAALGTARICCDPGATAVVGSCGWKVAPTTAGGAEAVDTFNVTANANDIYSCTFGVVITAGTGTITGGANEPTRWTLNRNMADWATGYRRC